MALGAIFYADTGSVEIGGTEYNASVTEISIEGGDRDFTEVYTFADSFEQEDRQAAFETTITTVAQDNSLARYVLGGAEDTTWAISYSGDTTTRTKPDIKYRFFEETSSGDALMFVFSGAYGVSISNSVDAEGYLTEEIRFKCLAKNFSRHYTGEVGASGLP